MSSDVEQRLASPRTAEAIYSASNPCQLSGAKKSRAGGPRKKRKLDSDATRTGTRTRLFWAEVLLPALREIFVRLQDSRNLWKSLLLVLPFGIPCSAQHRTLPASCSVLCAAFGRKGWQKICKAWACLGPGVALQRERERELVHPGERKSSSRRIPTSSVRRSSSAWSRSSCPRRRCSRPSHASSFSSTEESQEKKPRDNFGKTQPPPPKKKKKNRGRPRRRP